MQLRISKGKYNLEMVPLVKEKGGVRLKQRFINQKGLLSNRTFLTVQNGRKEMFRRTLKGSEYKYKVTPDFNDKHMSYSSSISVTYLFCYNPLIFKATSRIYSRVGPDPKNKNYTKI